QQLDQLLLGAGVATDAAFGVVEEPDNSGLFLTRGDRDADCPQCWLGDVYKTYDAMRLLFNVPGDRSEEVSEVPTAERVAVELEDVLVKIGLKLAVPDE